MNHPVSGDVSVETFERITELRIHHPELVEQEARRRKRRTRLTRDGKLVLVALDHPARGITGIRNNPLAMGDRFDLLARARRILADPDLDGVLASTDVAEDLLLLHHVERRSGGRGFMDGRVLIGSMNRGGLAGAAFEMEDAFTSFTAQRLQELGCDGGKMLWRLDPQDPASGRTMVACAEAMNELRRHRLPVFLEPLAVVKRDARYETQRDSSSIVRICGIAAALSESSMNVWLKVPYCDDFARVGRATTLPILLLGGHAREDPAEMIREFAAGFSASSRVRGAIIGRNLLFPGELDPLPACQALTAMVHRGAAVDEAFRMIRGHNLARRASGAARPSRVKSKSRG